jgi:hypothetical protein
MATTDTRTGFRLPWSSDHRDPDDDETVAETTDATTGPEGAEASPAEPTELSEETASEATTGAASPREPSVDAPAVSAAAPTMAPEAPPTGTGRTSVPFGADAYAPQATTTKKPSKFLADLTAAMRAAAETERVDIVERFQTDAKSYIESIHERSAGDVVELRKQADQDIVEIRDWSKAEIARIREETDRKITGRKQDLDEELEAHAARVEREIDRIRSTVDGFDAQMAAFFEGLLAVDDPTRFAAMAANLPEPPALDQVAAGIAKVTPPPPVEATTAPERQHETITSEAPSTGLEPSAAHTVPAVETPPAVETEPEGTAASASGATPSDLDPWRDAPFAGTSDDAGANDDAADASPVAATSDGAPEAESEGAPAEMSAEATTSDADVTSEGIDALASHGETDQGPADADEPQPEGASPAEVDPRVAALGLTPDLAAAEAEALVGADAEDDGSAESVPVFDEDAIAARLATFSMPTEPSPEAVKTQVIVTGLASVASISGFKRTLAQVAGVRQVSVASGPDGEFVFSVTHGPAVELTAVIPSMNGFAARVMGAEEGVLRVAAHDPEAGS